MTSSGGPGEVLVRFPTHPHSIRTARSLVADAVLAWGLGALADDARLVVSELATNAVLHSGGSTFQLSLVRTVPSTASTTAPSTGPSVRIAVGDDGAVPAAAVVRRSRPVGGTATAERPATTTGRGLGIVEELTSAWGVLVDGTTKWVWAELSTGSGRSDHPAGPPAPAAASAGPLPPGWHVVRLVDCPVALGLAQDDHLDELVRELQLLDPGTDEPDLAPVIRGLLDGQAQARHMGRRTAQDAAAQGREAVTIHMVLPAPAAEQVERLDDAVAAADALCERARLLTLASAPEVRRLRAWMREEISGQIRHDREPRPWDALATGS